MSGALTAPRPAPPAPPPPPQPQRAAAPPVPASAPARSTLQPVARGLLGVGAFAALFVGYELGVSGLLQSRAQADLLTQFKRTIITTTLDSPTVLPTDGSAVALLDIPSIGVHQVVVEGTSPSDLKAGPGHMSASPMPGEFGNAVIAGRRTTYGAPFSRLNQLRRGATIDVVTGQGRSVYTVTSVARVSATDTRPFLGNGRSQLTLLTSDPALLATGRIAVSASLHGRPIALADRPLALVGATDLGLAADPLGLALGLIWLELLLAAVWVAWRVRRRWPPAVLYMLAAPVLLALTFLTFSSVDLLLPGTL